jgi:hypothetical protein
VPVALREHFTLMEAMEQGPRRPAGGISKGFPAAQNL